MLHELNSYTEITKFCTKNKLSFQHLVFVYKQSVKYGKGFSHLSTLKFRPIKKYITIRKSIARKHFPLVHSGHSKEHTK